MKKIFSGYNFEYIGYIEPEISDGNIVTPFMPQSRYKKADTAALNKYGEGPFCKFVVARGVKKSGVYIIMLDEIPVYVGECINLEERDSRSGYGGISPRNCYKGGQETNCRINNLIYKAVREGGKLSLWFHELDASKEDRCSLETVLVKELSVRWNR